MEAIFLVDNISRINLIIDIGELKRFNIQIISDLKEIASTEYSGEPVIILEGFIQSEYGISDLILYKELLKINYIFISNNDTLLFQMEKYAKTFSFDTSHIGYTTLLAAINDDTEASEPFRIETEDKFVKLAHMICDNLGIVDNTLRDMASAFLNLIEDNKRLYNKLAEADKRMETINAVNRNKESQLHYLSSLVDNMLRQTVKVNDALSDYSFLCQKEVFKKVSLDGFKNRPNIIYFKEFGDFLHLDTFIYTIAEVLKEQYDIPTKVLWIMDKHNTLKIKYIPKYYTIFSEGIYNKPAIHTSDYICTTGGYDGIIRTICENQSSVENLVIIDSKPVNDIVLSISDIIRFDLCRSKSKIKDYGLLNSRTIVNNEEEQELSWNHFSKYNNLNKEDRFLYLANRPVMHYIVNVMQQTFNQY